MRQKVDQRAGQLSLPHVPTWVNVLVHTTYSFVDRLIFVYTVWAIFIQLQQNLINHTQNDLLCVGWNVKPCLLNYFRITEPVPQLIRVWNFATDLPFRKIHFRVPRAESWYIMWHHFRTISSNKYEVRQRKKNTRTSSAVASRRRLRLTALTVGNPSSAARAAATPPC